MRDLGMRMTPVAVLVVAALAFVLAACGDTAAPAETAAEATPATTQATAPATATEAPAPPPPTPTPQPTAAPVSQATAAPTAAPTEPPAPARPTAVDFSLPSAQGPQYTLSSFAGQQPVVVVFYRAFW